MLSNGEAEVDELDDAIATVHDVIRLDISVNNAL